MSGRSAGQVRAEELRTPRARWCDRERRVRASGTSVAGVGGLTARRLVRRAPSTDGRSTARRSRRQPAARLSAGYGSRSVRRLAVEGDHARVEDLVADRLVEEPVVPNAGRRAVAVGDALRLQEEGLSEALGRRDDELVAPLLFEEALDPRGAVEEGGIQVVGDLDVVGINRPGTHGGFQTG